MGTRAIEFEELPMGIWTETVEYSYSHDPGNLNGLPENCWPESEEGEVTLMDGWEDRLLSHYMFQYQIALNFVKGRIMDMEHDDMPKQWDAEDGEAAADAKAEALYDERRGA